MIERTLAGVTLAICALLLLRLLIGARHRARVDALVRRRAHAAWQSTLSIANWRGRRRAAQRAAEDAIRRAARKGEWDGNVYKPKSFRKPPDQLH